MTEQTEARPTKKYYEQIGPVPGLINLDHARTADVGGWWRSQPEDDTRWTIPGLWPWGHLPLLSGQPKAGKTTAVVDLIAALLIPGRRFLNYFEPSQLTEDDRHRGITLINAETPMRALVDELMAATEDDPGARDWLDPIHLERAGGAGTFDLTDPSLFDRWAHKLTSCDDCDRSDDWTPAVVIVDGLTAILAAAGKGVEHYGLWYAQFRLLMNELRVPNALVVGHSTLAGSHSMGGTEALAGPDGLWSYASDNVDNPQATRRFSVTPRLGGSVVPPLRVVRDSTGRLVVPDADGPARGRAGTADSATDKPSDETKAENEIRDALRGAWCAGLRKTEITGSGSWGKVKRTALAHLVASGEVVERPEGQGRRYWLAEAVQS